MNPVITFSFPVPEIVQGEIGAELVELCSAACRRIIETVVEARVKGKYGPYVWASETFVNQLNHAAEHVASETIVANNPDVQRTEADLDHAITRLAIAGALKDRECPRTQASRQ